VAINGPEKQTPINELTADAIRACGKKVADDILAAGHQARDRGDQLEQEAEKLAKEITEMVNGYAEHANEFLEKCRAASESFTSHRTSLINEKTVTPLSKISSVGGFGGGTFTADMKRLENDVLNPSKPGFRS